MDAAEDEDDNDGASLMQLSPHEAARLAEHDVDDRIRRLLRDLLVGMNAQEARGEGVEYRWGVAPKGSMYLHSRYSTSIGTPLRPK